MDLEDRQAIDLFFTDECGFSLTSSIPYDWIPTGEQRTIRSTKNLVANTLDYLSTRSLKNALVRIVKQYDNQFCINFSKNFFK